MGYNFRTAYHDTDADYATVVPWPGLAHPMPLAHYFSWNVLPLDAAVERARDDAQGHRLLQERGTRAVQRHDQ